MKKIMSLLGILMLSVTLYGCGENTDAELTGITVYSRDSESGTRGAFHEIIGIDDALLVDEAIITSGNGDEATKVGNDTNGIGYVSLSTDFSANGIKALTYNGVVASVENTINGTYTLARPFNYTTRNASDFASDDVKAMVEAFTAYLGTKDGIASMVAEGVIIDATNAPTWASIKDQHTITSTATTTVTLKFGGSTSVEKAIEAAANAFKAVVPKFAYEMNQTGSGDGFKRTLGSEKDSNPADVGFASRSFKDSEDVSTALSSGVFALDAIAVVVHKDNPLVNITKESVLKVYTGEITTWDQLN